MVFKNIAIKLSCNYDNSNNFKIYGYDLHLFRNFFI